MHQEQQPSPVHPVEQAPSVEWDFGELKKGDRVRIPGQDKMWVFEGFLTLDGQEQAVVIPERPEELRGIPEGDFTSETRFVSRADLEKLNQRSGEI